MPDNPYEPPLAMPAKLVEAGHRSGINRMSPRELFGIIVRTTGLLTTLYGLGGLIGALYPEVGYRAGDYLIGYAPMVLAGVILFFGADSVVSLAYGMRYMHYDDEPPIEDKPKDYEG